MTLQQVIMQIAIGNKKVKKFVMLNKCGLAIHKGEGVDSNSWTISHFNSGRSVLRHIKARKDAEQYIEKLVEILPLWIFTEEEWSSYTSTYRQLIKERVDILKQEILKKE